MLYPPGFYYVKKPKRVVILSSDKSSERNLSCFFDIIKPRRVEHLQKEDPFSSDPYFSVTVIKVYKYVWSLFSMVPSLPPSKLNWTVSKYCLSVYLYVWFYVQFTHSTALRTKKTVNLS